MKVDGVLFIDHEVLKLDKNEFVESHKHAVFADLPSKEREKKLADIYDRISGKGKKQSQDGFEL